MISPISGLVLILLLNFAHAAADKMHFPDEVGGRHSRQVGDGCDITVTDEEGWLFSPNYPSNYDNQRDCTYTVKKWRRNVCQVQLTINDFDLGDSANCRSDYLDIRQGSPNAGSRFLCGSLPTGTKKKLTFPRGRNTMILRFHSDVSQTYKGFMVKVKQIPNSCGGRDDPDDYPVPNPPNPPVSCDKYISEYNGVITSPDYPDDYPPNSRCRYTIQKPDRGVCKVELIFRTFELEQSPSCRNDFLEIPGGARLCGTYLTPAVLEYLPGSNSMSLTFFSDGYGSAPGFEAEVRQVRNSCGRDKPPKPVLDPQPLQPQPQYYPNPNVGGVRSLAETWSTLNRLGLQLYYRLLGAGQLTPVNLSPQPPPPYGNYYYHINQHPRQYYAPPQRYYYVYHR